MSKTDITPTESTTVSVATSGSIAPIATGACSYCNQRYDQVKAQKNNKDQWVVKCPNTIKDRKRDSTGKATMADKICNFENVLIV